jgi:hypothetical protein
MRTLNNTGVKAKSVIDLMAFSIMKSTPSAASLSRTTVSLR